MSRHSYVLGLVYIDIKYLPQMPYEILRRYLVVAINCAIRWVFLHIYGDLTDNSSVDFLLGLKRVSPINITRIHRQRFEIYRPVLDERQDA